MCHFKEKNLVFNSSNYPRSSYDLKSPISGRFREVGELEISNCKSVAFGREEEEEEEEILLMDLRDLSRLIIYVQSVITTARKKPSRSQNNEHLRRRGGEKAFFGETTRRYTIFYGSSWRAFSSPSVVSVNRNKNFMQIQSYFLKRHLYFLIKYKLFYCAYDRASRARFGVNSAIWRLLNRAG